MIEAVLDAPRTVLELEIVGTAGDGGPVAASQIEVIGGGWHHATAPISDSKDV